MRRGKGGNGLVRLCSCIFGLLWWNVRYAKVKVQTHTAGKDKPKVLIYSSSAHLSPNLRFSLTCRSALSFLTSSSNCPTVASASSFACFSCFNSCWIDSSSCLFYKDIVKVFQYNTQQYFIIVLYRGTT